jgi:hypothetical protein
LATTIFLLVLVEEEEVEWLFHLEKVEAII